jgi:hypothetical protein
MRLLIMQSSPAFHHFLHLRYKYSPQHPVLKYKLHSSLSVREQVSHTYKTGKIMVLCILMLIVLERRQRRKETLKRKVVDRIKDL